MAIRETCEPLAPTWASTSVKRGPENRVRPVQGVAVVISCAGRDASCSDSIRLGLGTAPPDTAISAPLAGMVRKNKGGRNNGGNGGGPVKREKGGKKATVTPTVYFFWGGKKNFLKRCPARHRP